MHFYSFSKPSMHFYCAFFTTYLFKVFKMIQFTALHSHRVQRFVTGKINSTRDCGREKSICFSIVSRVLFVFCFFFSKQKWTQENSQLPEHLQRTLPRKPETRNGNVDDWNQLAWEATQVGPPSDARHRMTHDASNRREFNTRASRATAFSAPRALRFTRRGRGSMNRLDVRTKTSG